MQVVQHVDKNYSARDIRALSGSNFLVRGVWYTIQGEGPFAGHPAIFIRLAGCNRGAKIDCSWCDTKFDVDTSTSMPLDVLLSKVQALVRPDWKNPLVVLTGGEPLLHECEPLVSALSSLGIRVQLETNGDLVRSNTLPEAYLVVSPKLSGVSGKYASVKDEQLLRADALKILVSANPDDPYHYLPPYIDKFVSYHGRESVFISPINVYSQVVHGIASMWKGMYDMEACQANYEYAGQLVQDNFYRLSLQTHIFVNAL